MKNKSPYIIAAILFVMVSIIVFVIPTEKTAGFGIVYAFTVAAFAVQIIIWRMSFEKKQDLKSKILGVSTVYVSTVYLVAQLIVLAVFTFVPSIKTWIAVILCVLISGISAILMISTSAGTEIISEVEVKAAKKRQFIKNLQIDVEMLAETESNAEIKDMLKKLAEKVRFSDPMSDGSLEDLENQISERVNDLENSGDKLNAIQEIETMLIKRNKKVKALKG
ncbi:MAG: hypothetical protein J1F11_06490 [Oscillospiraceae bacterium]|nr:hypothetical protein [Oscillospiraceae bacterium]